MTKLTGSIINACGESAVIKKVLFQDVNLENLMADVEFIDENGNYRHWKSWADGGTLTFHFEKEA